MKKFVFVLPFIAISLLANCNNGGGDKPGPEPEVSILPIKCYQYQKIGKEPTLVATEQYQYNDKNLLVKSVNQFVANIIETHEYEYDDKNNVTKDTHTYKEGEETAVSNTVYEYTYDQLNRILTKREYKDDELDFINEYTYESDLVDWKTFKYSVGGGSVVKNITRTFKDGLYINAIDSISDKYFYYTWDEHKCNTKIETYDGEEKTPANHFSDETYEYHRNMPNKTKKYVLSYYEEGKIESNEITSTEYDEHDRMIKISNYDEEVLKAYMTYEYGN